jgi:DNA polymerase-3 subunit epsilon
MFAIIDIETTGGDPKVNKITEVAILIHDGEKLIDQYTTLVNPEQEIPPFIAQLTGITNEMVQNAPPFRDVARQIEQITQNKIFVAHNVRFDYYFMKEEFKKLGIPFQRKQLCTVRLSRKILPGLVSYSLGNLCEQIQIPIYDRHRAMGDAAATLKLFQRLLESDQENHIQQALAEKQVDSLLTPFINRGKIEDLPEETGIYYLHDEKGDVLYVGQSSNIQKRVLNHFTNNSKAKYLLDLNEEVRDITYDITGSELIAELLEWHEIKTRQPRFNVNKLKKIYTYGAFIYIGENGFIQIEIDRLKKRTQEPWMIFPDNVLAKTFLKTMSIQFNLCFVHCHLTSETACLNENPCCLGACLGREPVESYNERVEQALTMCRYPQSNFMIIGKGSDLFPHSAVCIENGRYIGFGFFDNTQNALTLDQIRECIRPYQDDQEVARIITSYLKRNRRDKILVY